MQRRLSDFLVIDFLWETFFLLVVGHRQRVIRHSSKKNWRGLFAVPEPFL